MMLPGGLTAGLCVSNALQSELRSGGTADFDSSGASVMGLQGQQSGSRFTIGHDSCIEECAVFQFHPNGVSDYSGNARCSGGWGSERNPIICGW